MRLAVILLVTALLGTLIGFIIGGGKDFLESAQDSTPIESKSAMEAKKAAASRGSSAPQPAPKPASKAQVPTMIDGDETRLKVSRTWLVESTRDLPRVLQEARAVPSTGGPNQVPGFKFLEILDGGMISKLGVKEGDFVYRVNGRAIGTPTEAMYLYTDLKEASRIELDLIRADRETQIVLEIQD